MLDLERFEENVYAAVTRELNVVVANIQECKAVGMQNNYVNLQKEVLKVLNKVTEETMAQILHATLYNQMANLVKNKC